MSLGEGELEGQDARHAVSADGSRVFFTDSQRLTANAGLSDLYECAIVEVEGVLRCDLTDLTPFSGGENAGVQGSIIGGSEDGSWVYFVANSVLAEGAADGQCNGQFSPTGATCNLYVRHDGGTRLVAVISGEDAPDFAEGAPTLSVLTARVSPDGRWLVFMSDRELTGMTMLM
jgi:hypothetical protein